VATTRRQAATLRKKPPRALATERACTCGFLERAAAEPDIPIAFEPLVDEYDIRHIGDQPGGHSIIRYCPWCGGAAPKSKRDTLFATITRAEAERLQDLARRSRLSSKDNQPGTIVSFRTLQYTNLSATADVDFIDFGPERGVHMSMMTKYVGPRGK